MVVRCAVCGDPMDERDDVYGGPVPICSEACWTACQDEAE